MAAQSMDRQVDLSCSTALLVSAMPLCVPAMAAAAAASSISDSTYASEITCTTSCSRENIVSGAYLHDCANCCQTGRKLLKKNEKFLGMPYALWKEEPHL